jgi:hypothetical protein
MTRLACGFAAVLLLVFAAVATPSVLGAEGKPKKPPEERFAKIDKDGDKKISLDEFVGKKTDEKKEKATKRFSRLDKDANESLSLEEFVAGQKKK